MGILNSDITPFAFENVFFAFLQKFLFFIRLCASFCLGGESCVRCGNRSFVFPLCRRCRRDFAESDFSRRCGVCGKELVSELEICSACRKSPVIKDVEKVFPLHSYRFWKKSLLFDWKLGGKRSMSVYFAGMVAKKLKEIESENGPFFIVPVPPRPGKIREKGWDQVEELCFYLKYGWNFQVAPVLTRLSSVQQKKLGRAERLSYGGNSYALTEKKKLRRFMKKNQGRAVIIDDVITTGSTIQNCAELLISAGFKSVYALSIFIVD
ncbi:MAG: ComF family protein [Treponema sp.]|nr:ComF family protein [Treponema sp.]